MRKSKGKSATAKAASKEAGAVKTGTLSAKIGYLVMKLGCVLEFMSRDKHLRVTDWQMIEAICYNQPGLSLIPVLCMPLME
jgi:hypothetical protein